MPITKSKGRWSPGRGKSPKRRSPGRRKSPRQSNGIEELTKLVKKVHVDVFPREFKKTEKFATEKMGLSKLEAKRFATQVIADQKKSDKKVQERIKKQIRIEAERRKRMLLKHRRDINATLEKMGALSL